MKDYLKKDWENKRFKENIDGGYLFKSLLNKHNKKSWVINESYLKKVSKYFIDGTDKPLGNSLFFYLMCVLWSSIFIIINFFGISPPFLNYQHPMVFSLWFPIIPVVYISYIFFKKTRMWRRFLNNNNFNDSLGLKSGIIIQRKNIFFYNKKKKHWTRGYDISKINFEMILSLIEINSNFLIINNSPYFLKWTYEHYKHDREPVPKIRLSKNEINFFNEFLSQFEIEVDKCFNRFVSRENTNRKKVEKRIENEKKQIKILKQSKSNVLLELDKDGNGILDVIEGNDDFMKLFRKHQSLIKEFDKNYINNLVKISNYLKIKSKNIQQIFIQIRKTKNQTELKNYVGLLKNQIHTYESVFYHSLQLINSIVQDDFITVNEIYEEFDKLKMFKSDHEKEVSEKLSDIKDGLSDLMYSIDSMERNIVGGLNELTYITSDGFSVLNNSLGNELKSIQSTLGLNNLLTGIQTYQMYKINKNTKSLRS